MFSMFDLGTQEEAAEAYDIAAIKFRGTSAVTNFDISRYDVKRICSSSTLIAGDLAKRSPKHSGPLALEDYNSCASSACPRAFLPITNGGSNSDELADMMWNGGSDVQNGAAKDGSNMGPDRMEEEFGDGGYTGGYFSLEGQKHDDDDDESFDHASSNRIGEMGLVHQTPMFALWND